jgi:hypothetical protein
LRKITPVQFAGLLAACTIAAAYVVITEKTMSATVPEETADVVTTASLSSDFVTSALPLLHQSSSHLRKDETSGFDGDRDRLEAAFDAVVEQQVRMAALVEQDDPKTNALVEPRARTEAPVSVTDRPPGPVSLGRKFSYLAYYVFSEIPPDEKPADTFLKTIKDIPVGTPVEEIKRVSDAVGLDFNFMKAVAKIESGFNPKQRTGSYIGLYQLSKSEFRQYGSGSITDARDNAIAGAFKFATEALLFEYETGKKPTFSDLYLIHQQGWQGAAQHVSQPKRIAWKSMCATDEGKEKGERWCKRAIWGNTLPAIKSAWKSVEKLTSSAFVSMWQQRVDELYARYSLAATKN